MHPRRERERGYNQSKILAETIAKKLDLKCQEVFEKVKDTKFQVGLKKDQRQENLKNAFAVKKAPEEIDSTVEDASALGRGYPVAGGVANAVKEVAQKLDPTREIKVEGANTLSECVKMMKLAKAGRKNGYLLEGMACPGGCIAGVGTIASTTRVKKNLDKFINESQYKYPFDNKKIEKQTIE